jgi:hypothetical protein
VEDASRSDAERIPRRAESVADHARLIATAWPWDAIQERHLQGASEIVRVVEQTL